MPYGQRDPNASAGASATSFPIARALALTILAAGLFIFLLRHIYGSISIEAGAR